MIRAPDAKNEFGLTQSKLTVIYWVLSKASVSASPTIVGPAPNAFRKASTVSADEAGLYASVLPPPVRSARSIVHCPALRQATAS